MAIKYGRGYDAFQHTKRSLLQRVQQRLAAILAADASDDRVTLL
jgi:hypothetical protein